MKNAIIQSIENDYLKKEIPEFSPGDNVRVMVKIVEGTNSRVQSYEGVCIARKNAGVGSSFTVRKISYGEGVERIFPLHSPMIDSIILVRRGKVRRAKLYYLRDLRGKAARIVEKVVRNPADEATKKAERNAKKAEKNAKKAEKKAGKLTAISAKAKPAETTSDTKE